MVFYPELKGPALAALRSLVQEMKVRAHRVGISGKDLLVRPMTATDIRGGSAEDWDLGYVADAFAVNISTVTIAANRFVGIYGYTNSLGTVQFSVAGAGGTNSAFGKDMMIAPIVTAIRITRKGAVARIWDIAPIFNFPGKTGFVDDPVIFDENTQLSLEAYASVATATSMNQVVPIGIVVEKRGLRTT